uniref:TerD domain-containing protein n=1 Tax=Alexandrium catenella TaxID=2925 RepID=A0A7S1Q8N6_ALECA
MAGLKKNEDLPVLGVRFGVGLSWDHTNGPHVDLDLQAVAFSNAGVLMDAVYFNNLKALGKGLTHSGDETTGERSGFDELVWAHLERLPSEVALVAIVLAAHGGCHLRDAKNGKFTVLEDTTEKQVARFDLEESVEEVDLVGALLRVGNGWVFRLIEIPAQDGRHFIDILEPTIGNFVRSVIPGAPKRIKAAFSMEKGSVVDLPRTSHVKTIKTALGWDTSSGKVDLDVSAVLLDGNHKEWDCIFFGKQHGQGLTHSGDNLTGAGEGDDEVITVNLEQVPKRVEQIILVINIYTKGKSFALVANPYCRVLAANGDELCLYKLNEAGDKEALIIARLFREYGGERWGFQALGIPCIGQTWKDSMPHIKQAACVDVRTLQQQFNPVGVHEELRPPMPNACGDCCVL